jgi:prefoldin subunit 5
MKPTEQLVAAIREVRHAMDRLADADLADTQPTVRQALESQAKALQADVERLLEEIGSISESDAFEKDLIS